MKKCVTFNPTMGYLLKTVTLPRKSSSRQLRNFSQQSSTGIFALVPKKFFFSTLAYAEVLEVIAQSPPKIKWSIHYSNQVQWGFLLMQK